VFSPQTQRKGNEPAMNVRVAEAHETADILRITNAAYQVEKFFIDTDRLSELSEDRARLWAQVGAADFISRDEKREMLGYAVEGSGE